MHDRNTTALVYINKLHQKYFSKNRRSLIWLGGFLDVLIWSKVLGLKSFKNQTTASLHRRDHWVSGTINRLGVFVKINENSLILTLVEQNWHVLWFMYRIAQGCKYIVLHATKRHIIEELRHIRLKEKEYEYDLNWDGVAIYSDSIDIKYISECL